MNRGPDLYLADQALREWAFFFRDRRRFEHCRSIEHRYRRIQGDADPDGWGDVEAAPKTSPGASYRLQEAILTHDHVMSLPKLNKWAITFAYCYPNLERALVLRMMKKWTGRRLNWKTYLEALNIGLYRVHTAISCGLRLQGNKKAA